MAIDVNQKDRHTGRTPLTMAIAYKKFEIAEILLKGGADPNIFGAGTPLKTAISIERPDFVELLLKYGANIEDDVFGNNFKNNVTPLRFAAYIGVPETIKVLVKYGADINSTNDNGINALFMAIREHRWQAARTLVNLGIDLTAITDANNSIIDWVTTLYAVPKDLQAFIKRKYKEQTGIDPDKRHGRKK